VILILGAVVLLAVLGGVLGAAMGHTPWLGIGVAVLLGSVLAAVAWSQGDSIVLGAAGAREIDVGDDAELVNVVEEMCIAAGLPRPKIYLIDSDAMNAFATGMRPDKAAVAVTRGLRARLNRAELQGVMAHEMAHVGNYDTRVMVLMAVIVGSIAIMSDVYLRGMRFRGRGKGAPVMALIAILLAILAPLAAVLIQLAVSRKREYLADATAAAMTRDPGALADALEKLSGCREKLESANRGTQHLFIVNPFRLRQQLNNPFASHPPILERIRRLRQLAGQRVQTA